VPEIRSAVDSDRKGRYEIVEATIRARYGHSATVPVEYQEVEPPPRLYHGTSPGSLQGIQQSGLQPQGRRYVHLSVDERTAIEVGRRRSAWPIILEVDTEAARKAGIRFYRPVPSVFLTEGVPPEFVRPRDRGRTSAPQYGRFRR
jgi:putative RNA 2'-phosphotransferase